MAPPLNARGPTYGPSEMGRRSAWTDTRTEPRPSKPPGCRSRRCRRRTSGSCGGLRRLEPGRLRGSLAARDPELGIHRSRSLVDPRIYRGTQEVEHFWNDWKSAWAGTRWEIDEYIDAGHDVIVIGRFYGRGAESGASVEANVSQLMTVRNGRLVRGVLFQAESTPSKPPGCGSRAFRIAWDESSVPTKRGAAVVSATATPLAAGPVGAVRFIIRTTEVGRYGVVWRIHGRVKASTSFKLKPEGWKRSPSRTRRRREGCWLGSRRSEPCRCASSLTLPRSWLSSRPIRR